MKHTLLAALLAMFPLLALADEAEPKGAEVPSEEAMKKWNKGETLIVAELKSTRDGPSLLTNPPKYNTFLTLTVQESLRGTLKKNDDTNGVLQTVGKQPNLAKGKKHLVSLTNDRGGYRVEAIEELTDARLKDARAVAAMPPGWSVETGKFVSPWASLGKKAWPGGLEGKSAIRCGKTGRPALNVGADVKMMVEKVQPVKQIKFQNPDGDGEYKITLENTTKNAVKVPALFTDGKSVYWGESIVIVCQGRSYSVPGAKGIPEGAKPVELKPGETLSGSVNALTLDGPMWPRGGYRIEFRFCLGEKAVSQSFYYYSKHHDVIRAGLQGKK